MSYFFNGREWITPATMSAVNDSALAPTNENVGNVTCYLGLSTGGEPGVVLSFGSPDEAQATLVSGELLTAAMKAFSASNETGGPASVDVIRVNPATPSTLTLVDANSVPLINVSSADWGARTAQIKLTVEAGSTQGLGATVTLGSASYSIDNLYANPFSVAYTGAAPTANMSITPTSVVLQAPAGTVVATIPLATYPTVGQLVDFINTLPGFDAVVNGGSINAPSLNGLDAVTSASVLVTGPNPNGYEVTATLNQLMNWMNSLNSYSQPLITAKYAAGYSGLMPTHIPFTYLQGGSDGVTTASNYDSALTTLQNSDVQWITPISSDPDVWAMVDAHAQYMSTVGGMERRAIVGSALGTTDAEAIAFAFNLNSNRTSLVHLGYYDYDLTGVLSGLQLYSPYLTAAAIAGAFSGVSPGTAMTNKAMSFSGLERYLNNPTDTDPLLQGGVIPLVKAKTGYMVVQSISTWLVNENYDKVEQSVGWALDYTCRTSREALDPLRGAKITPITLGRAVTLVESNLKALAVPDPQGPGVLAGDAANPAYQNISAQAIGTAIAVSFQCSPVLPANYVSVTVYAVPFSGTASA
ncbi:hypothetical protein PQR39_35720 [Paraburkholderia sediminicola]|uniref:hypothetical protein n=1 Tax=Paraburkholderia sediminicola TaxID=458836 RepID=UPI0038B79564